MDYCWGDDVSRVFVVQGWFGGCKGVDEWWLGGCKDCVKEMARWISE